MTTSPDLGIPYVSSQQAQPELTHNDALNMIAALFKGATSRGLNIPPVSPVDGDTYIVGTSPTGAWAGKANKIASWTQTAWIFVPGRDSDGIDIPIGARHAGLLIYNHALNQLEIWSGTAWGAFGGGGSATSISFDPPPGMYAGDVQGAIDEVWAVTDALQSEIGTGGVPEAPIDGTAYVRKNAAWTAETGGGIPEAPTDSVIYGRENSAWVPVSGSTPTDASQVDYGSMTVQEALDALFAIGVGIAEAPIDGTAYVRKNAAWVAEAAGGGTTPKSVAAFLASFPSSANSPVVTSANGRGINLTGAASSSQLRYIYKTLPNVNDTFIAGAQLNGQANYNGCGLFFRDSGSGKSDYIGTTYNNGLMTIEHAQFNSDTASNTSTSTAGFVGMATQVYLRMDYNATTKVLSAYYSLNRFTWIPLGTSSSLANPNQVGLMTRHLNGSTTADTTFFYYSDAAATYDFSTDVAVS